MGVRKEIRTLEDLRDYYQSEAKYLASRDGENADYSELDVITDKYILNADELEYVRSVLLALEEQTNRKTLINTVKAKKIILRRKNK